MFRVLSVLFGMGDCRDDPSLVIGILRLVIQNIAAGETEVFQFLLKALAMHSDSFGGAGDVAPGFDQHAFDVGALEFAARFAEIGQVGNGQNVRSFASPRLR